MDTIAASDEPVNGLEEQSGILDPGLLMEIQAMEQNGMPGLVSKVVGKYIQHASTLMEVLRTAIERGDAEALFHAAHSLKGSSAGVGAVKLADLCATLEAMGRRGEAASVALLRDEITPVYESSCEGPAANWLTNR